jgi:hypothetical protein
MTSRLHPTGAFLHLPRTGGTWVYRVLGEAGIIAGTLGGEHSSGHHEKWAFTVVRNPVDWWCSVWRFQCDNGWPAYPDGAHPLHEVGKIARCDLQDWVNAASELEGLCGGIYAAFTLNANFVLRTEHLRSDLEALGGVVKWVGVNYQAPIANESKVTKSLGMVDVSRLVEAEAAAFNIWKRAGL